MSNVLSLTERQGGFLADPVTAYPGLFGKNSFFGGENGVQWMTKYPYALPNVVSAIFLISSALVVILGLEEVGNSCLSIERH